MLPKPVCRLSRGLSLASAQSKSRFRPSPSRKHNPKPEDYRQRFLQAVTELSKAFALAVPHDKALAIRDDVGFFQAVRAAMSKGGGEKKKTGEERDAAIRQIISRAVASDEVVDIFAAAGLKKPDISILSDQFLAEVRGMPQKNLAVELLRKLLSGEIKIRVMVRRILRKHGYPPDLQEQATKTVLAQAELLCADWAA